jgi:hypothetical protein
VSIARFPGFTDRRQVSRGGGMQPIWRRDGKELFYLGADARIYAVSIQEGASRARGALRNAYQAGLELRPIRSRRQRPAIPRP